MSKARQKRGIICSFCESRAVQGQTYHLAGDTSVLGRVRIIRTCERHLPDFFATRAEWESIKDPFHWPHSTFGYGPGREL